jgi:hypothetical protein
MHTKLALHDDAVNEWTPHSIDDIGHAAPPARSVAPGLRIGYAILPPALACA